MSGAVARATGGSDPNRPTSARVVSSAGETLGFGDYSERSNVRVRLYSFGKDEPPPDLIVRRIHEAVARREANPLLANTDARRLVNAEGDGLPGVVVDAYADVVVAKFTTAGMASRRDAIADALQIATGAAHGYERVDGSAARREGVVARQGPLWGVSPTAPVRIREGARRYAVDVVHGQKTGFYLDQRDARDLVESLSAGRRVLDLFSYTGGFAVAAACGGATRVEIVDSSVRALGMAADNLRHNDPASVIDVIRADAFNFLRPARGADAGSAPKRGPYDLIVIDPPPLARNRRDTTRATRAYKDLLLFALRAAAPGAHLLAFACSHHIGPDLFRKVAFAASLDAHRSFSVLRSLGAPADHPVSIDHPEGSYLTGLLLQV